MNMNSCIRSIARGLLIASVATLAPSIRAAAPQSTPAAAARADQSSMYQMVLVDRDVKAVKYEHRTGSSKINFAGTDLMPSAKGEAKVASNRGAIKVKVEFWNVKKPSTFGPEYLTYVMWAISPEGRAVNMGEVLIGENDRSKLDVTTDLQAFAMIVTAEPYYAVRRPSNVVILENEIRSDTKGDSEVVDAKYELVGRGGYIPTGYKFDPVVMSANLPLEFFEARNALRIAQSAGAEQYATSSYNDAAAQMKQADDMASLHSVDRKRLSATSRLAVQTAEDAREISVKHIDEAREAAAHDADANRVSSARADARNARDEAASAKGDAANSDRARMDAERNASDAQNAARDAAAGQAQAEQATASAQQGEMNAKAESDKNRAAAMSSEQALQQAVHDREELRARLLVQFNTILETRDTARGLVVNLSDVLFDSGKFTLRSAAREKLAKISGIVLAYPSLSLAIEGNTDSVGGDDYNQTLSENRAGSVRDYLVTEGIPTASMTVRGLGKAQPVASNDTAEGRQQNRRVEMIVSGEVIGNVVGAGPAAMQTLPLSPR